MKKIGTILTFATLFVGSVYAQEINFVNYDGSYKKASSADEKATVKMQQRGSEATDWNFGTIEQNSPGSRYFKFTNTGSAPLIISDAKGSCGCTVPTWPKEPIMPGQSEYIKVTYDTKRVGAFTKYVTLTTNSVSNSSVRLKISGTVNAAEQHEGDEKHLHND